MELRNVVKARRFDGETGPVDAEAFVAFASSEMVVPAMINGCAPVATRNQIIFVLGDFRGDVWGDGPRDQQGTLTPVATRSDVRRIALSLPDTNEAKGHFAFSVRNKDKLKGFAWVWMERVVPKKPRVANPRVPCGACRECRPTGRADCRGTEEVLHRAALRRIPGGARCDCRRSRLASCVLCCRRPGTAWPRWRRRGLRPPALGGLLGARRVRVPRPERRHRARRGIELVPPHARRVVREQVNRDRRLG